MCDQRRGRGMCGSTCGERRGAAYMYLSVEAQMQEAVRNVHMQAAGRKFDAVVSILQYVKAYVVSPGISLW